ncbi:MAG: hypothetical protein HY318_18045 [Armatimonadetes bacterium]|nr:hypothetical protein [Armatimonadota bacterium]
MSFAISTAGLAATKTVVYDDFEVAPTTWAFRSMGNTGSQIVSAESAHQGKQSLQSETDRWGMENLRGGFRCREAHSRLSFWYCAEYDEQLSSDVFLVLGLRSEGERHVYKTQLRLTAPREWQQIAVSAEDVSPRLVGAWIDQLIIGLRGPATSLRLNLDEICLENQRKPSRGGKPTPELSAGSAPPPAGYWGPLERDALRAAAFSPKEVSLDLAPRLAEAGIDTFILVRPSDSELAHWAGLSSALHVAVLVALPLFYDPANRPEVHPAVFADGVSENLPCLMQEGYWDKVLAPLMERLAQLSTVVPLSGILLESNSPEGAAPAHNPADSCYCDECFSRFLELSQIKERVESFLPAERWPWLRENKLLSVYAEILQRRLSLRAELLRERLLELNPKLLLGLYGFEDRWIQRGVLAGLGTPSYSPAIVAREPTTTNGYSIAVKWESDRLKTEKIANRWLPGFDLNPFNPLELAANLSASSKGSFGYWIDLREPGKVPPEKLLEVLHRVNARLSESVGVNANRSKSVTGSGSSKKREGQ